MPSPGLSLNTAISGIHSGINNARKTASVLAGHGVKVQETIAAEKAKSVESGERTDISTTNSVDLTA